MIKISELFFTTTEDFLLGDRSTKGWLFDSILLIPFMGVYFFANLGYAWYFALIRFAISFLTVFFFLIRSKKQERKLFMYFLVITMLYAFSTLLNQCNIFDAFSRYYGMIMIICLVGLRKNNIVRLCYSIFVISEIFIYSNLFFLILHPYPDGLFFSVEGNANWIIGQKQDFVIVFLPCLISSLILWFNNLARKRIILVIIAMVYTLSLVLTLGLTVILLMLIVMVFYSYITNRNFKGKNLFKTYIFMEVACILISVSKEWTQVVFYYLDYIRSSAEAKVSKGDTMMERINMWYDAIHNISNNFWGLGPLYEGRFYRLMPNSEYHPHVHNMIIDMAHTGGLLCALTYLYINYKIYKHLDDMSSTNRNIILYSLFVSNILTLTECFYWPLSVFPLALSYIYICNGRNNIYSYAS